MSTLAREPWVPGVSLIRDELEAILSSELFVRAPSLAQFLSYVCTKALSGEADQIKEYSIAVEALGRRADFDQKEDAIVRVEAHRLRKRLKQYYQTAGAGHLIQIEMPAGQYVPRFVPKAAEPASAVLLPREPAADGQNGEALDASERALAPVIEILQPAPAVAPPNRRQFWAMAGVLAFLVVVAGIVIGRREPASAADSGKAAPPPAIPAAASPDGAIRIACGLTAPSYVDSLGNVWARDRYANGGTIMSSPLERILRTRDPDLFQNRREGNFRYEIPLAPGTYELRLYFAERVFGTDNLAGGGETTRLFHIYANGAPLVEYMDVISDAGGSNTADVRVFTGVSPASDGILHLQFTSFKENAFINAIEVVPGTAGKSLPVRILAGTSSYRDRNGNVWTADRYSVGGQIIVRPVPVAGTSEPDLYRSERFGNFSYAIPVGPGRYTINLHFAEAWFGPDKPTGGGPGSRRFDVYCNGVALLRNFDIYKTAGGPNRAVVRSFHGLSPNAQGKLSVSFVPVANYASLNAIEVISEGK